MPPEGYFEAIQAVLDRHDVLLIADEVVSGFGRLGAWFGSDVLGHEAGPDDRREGDHLGATSRSRACLVSEKIWRVLADRSGGATFSHGYTYTAHPIAAAAALANLDVIENDGLVEQAKSRGEYLRARLQDAFGEHPLVGEVRGIGLVAAVEFVPRRAAGEVRDDRRGRGQGDQGLPGARRDHARAAGGRLDLVLAAVRDHRGRDRRGRRRVTREAADRVAKEVL